MNTHHQHRRDNGSRFLVGPLTRRCAGCDALIRDTVRLCSRCHAETQQTPTHQEHR